MFYRLSLIALFIISIPLKINAQSLNNLKEINTVWGKFYQAFDSLDYKLMAEIHSKKLIRISGGKRITDYHSYIDNYELRFQRAKENKITNKISLRFKERINNDSIASERGVYKLNVTNIKKETQIYYGAFHVLFIKENGIWKILMDYDSNEDGKVGEKEYKTAFKINELEAFVQE